MSLSLRRAATGAGRARTVSVLVVGAGLLVGATALAPTSAAGAAVAPTVTTLSRSTGPTAGGTSVTVGGTGFQDVRSVHFGTRAATAVKVVSATELSAKAPAGTGLVDVTVTTKSATSATFDGDHYLYGGPSLTEKDLAPSSFGAFHIDDVTCPASGACVAVGRTGAIGGAPQIVGQPLAFAQSGTTWRRISVPVPTGWQYAELTDVACSAPGVCYALGTATKGTYPQPSVNFIARNSGDTVTVTTLPTGPTYGPLACATTSGSCVLAVRNGRSTAFRPLPLGSGPVQQGATLPSAPDIGLRGLRCRAAGSCVAWGYAIDTDSRTTAFAEHSINGVWSGTTITPLTGDDSTDLSTVLCDTATTCAAYGNSVRTGKTVDDTVRHPIKVQLSADGTIHVTAVPLDKHAGQAGEPVDVVSCATPNRCIGATNDPYSGVNWVDRLTTAGWTSTRFSAADGADVYRQVNDAQCTATGYCFGIGIRSFVHDFTGDSDATVFVPVGSGYAQLNLPSGSHQVVSPAVAACAPTGSYCVLVLDDTYDAGLGGQLTAPFTVTVRPAS